MSPQIEAAIIAASVGVLTLIATVVTQYLGRRATSRETKTTLDRTLKAQSHQLKQTLAEQRTRTLNERFATAASQLGGDQPPTVQLAGVYAMAVLADDWEENRQTCVDVLCAYLRMPYAPDPVLQSGFVTLRLDDLGAGLVAGGPGACCERQDGHLDDHAL